MILKKNSSKKSKKYLSTYQTLFIFQTIAGLRSPRYYISTVRTSTYLVIFGEQHLSFKSLSQSSLKVLRQAHIDLSRSLAKGVGGKGSTKDNDSNIYVQEKDCKFIPNSKPSKTIKEKS